MKWIFVMLSQIKKNFRYKIQVSKNMQQQTGEYVIHN